MFDDVEILVDLVTGKISVVVLPVDDAGEPAEGDPVEIECVTADEPFAPQE